ncbi:phospholipase A2 [Amycolatopsis minnesotensis]|uniref:Phospholipase A2-like protein n=1 Tax=Amycolatopsis minnesotensis TaxID=337894 RepID=A0ABP5E1Y8_9PSEU
MRKLIVAGSAAFLALLGGAGTALAETSAAPAAQAETPAAPAIQADGCTGVPDGSFGADFGPACNAHDNCYDVGSTLPRLTCDRILLVNLSDACQRQSFSVSLCVQQANIYFNGVRALGRSHYLGSGDPS